MKMKLVELENLMMGAKELIEKEMPIKISFKISRIMKKIEGEYEVYEEKKKKIISKFSKKDERGEIIEEDGKVTIQNVKDFQKEMNELNSIEIEVEVEKISINDLGEMDISPKTLIMLDTILED